jgi:hypothetical protein
MPGASTPCNSWQACSRSNKKAVFGLLHRDATTGKWARKYKPTNRNGVKEPQCSMPTTWGGPFECAGAITLKAGDKLQGAYEEALTGATWTDNTGWVTVRLYGWGNTGPTTQRNAADAGRYEADFTATKAGDYTLQTFLNGAPIVPHGKYTITVVAGAVDPAMNECSGAALTGGTVGKLSAIDLFLKDKYGNAVANQAGANTAVEMEISNPTPHSPAEPVKGANGGAP